MKAVAAMAAVVAAMAGFYGGLRFGQTQATASGNSAVAATKTPSPPNKAGQAGSGTPAGQCTSGGGPISGSVTQLTDSSFVVHNPVCDTDVKVRYTSSVAVRKTVSGQASDIQESQTVTVQGQSQADGTMRATTVTVNPGAVQGGRGPRG